MKEEAILLDYKSRLIDEIIPDKPFENTFKIKKIGRIFRDFRTSEMDNRTIHAPLSIIPGLKEEAIENNWSFTDFFPTKEYVIFQESKTSYTRKKSLSPHTAITVNRTVLKGSPYIMYTSDGSNYIVRKERATNNSDSSFTIHRNTSPIKIGLYKNASMFLEKDLIDIIDCISMKNYKIAAKNSVDFAIPEKHMSSIPVLRDLEESKGITTKKMFLDKIDMTTGKIDNYILHCYDSIFKFRKIANTWHPMQYICTSLDKASLVDLREKKSRLFWTLPKKGNGGGSRSCPKYQKAEKGQDSKVYIMQGRTLGTFDMRNLSNIFGEISTEISNPVLSVGKHIAVYNSGGRFFFQNPIASEDTIMKIYKFDITDEFIGFDWSGKSQNAPYSIAAFLFRNKLNVYYGDGTIAIHNIPKKLRNTGHRPAIVSESTGKISNKKDIMHTIISKPLLKRTKDKIKESHTGEKRNHYTTLERTLRNGFRDPMDADEPTETLFEPSECIKRIISYTKLLDLLPLSDRQSILKPKKEKKSKEADK